MFWQNYFVIFAKAVHFAVIQPVVGFFSLSLKGAVVKEQVFLNCLLPPKMDYTYLSRSAIFLSSWYKAAMWVVLGFLGFFTSLWCFSCNQVKFITAYVHNPQFGCNSTKSDCTFYLHAVHLTVGKPEEGIQSPLSPSPSSIPPPLTAVLPSPPKQQLWDPSLSPLSSGSAGKAGFGMERPHLFSVDVTT